MSFSAIIRTPSQKIGARGHKWLSSHIEESESWISRDLGEDYGIDMELELHEDGVKGDILKAQIKTEKKCTQKDGFVKFSIKRKYLYYADSCRYPVLLVLVCLDTKEAWYIWLQEWLLGQRVKLDPLSQQTKSWTVWVPATRTVQAGLRAELKAIARWESQTQLTLSLCDTIRCAKAANKPEIAKAVLPLVNISSSLAGVIGLNKLIVEAIELGNHLRGTDKGEQVTRQIFEIIRSAGSSISKENLIKLVMRGDTYSRAGVNALGILYDEYFPYALSLNLSIEFKGLAPEVSFYCAFRESNKDDLFPSREFRFAGLKYIKPEDPMSMYANRGASAILDCLMPDNHKGSK